jgi:transglutaminase-like putative cysteine protease
MRLTINHTTRYRYDVPATYALQQLRVRPQTTSTQNVLNWQLKLEGAVEQASFTDENGNLVDLVEFLPSMENVSITVTGEIETIDTAGITGAHQAIMPLWFYLRQTKLTKAGSGTSTLAKALGPAQIGETDIDRLHKLSQLILGTVPYTTGETGAQTTAEDALAHGKGVCQDHTHIFLSAARLLGYPARYVSGYLMMNDRVDQDASHAWAEAHIDGLGWVGFDVSNAISPDARYVHVARGLDYSGCAPTTGFIVGAERENLIVSLQVQQ